MDSFQGKEEGVLCREKQFKVLKGLIRENPCILPSCLFLHGVSGTGKSLVLTSVLKLRNVQVCYANCIEYYTQRIVYETLLHQLSGVNPNKANNYSPYANCDNFADFVKHVNKLACGNERRYAFVFEHSERLRDCDANVFPSLCRLQEFCEGINLCVIFTSRIPLDKFRGTMGILEPVVIHFPQYSKDELVKILVANCQPNNISEDCYSNYINLLLSVFYLATRSLPELKHLAELNFPAYCEPIAKGEAQENDLRLLWRNIEPKLRSALATVYLREVSSDQFKRMQELTDTGAKDLLMKRSSMTKMELPFYSKFLLIAAYLASYNPVRSDKRFFTKHHGKIRKTQAIIKAKQRSCSQLVGPKPFPLDRLLAIFYSIIEDKVSPTAHIFSQISTLVSLRLLTLVGNEDCLGSPKYRSNVSLDFIRSVARTVSFEVVNYLYDYNS